MTRTPPAGCSTEADLPAFGPEVEALHFGCISLIPEPCGSAYESLMRREHDKRVMMLDPNIRPGFIPDKAEASRPHASDDRHGRHRQTVRRGPRLVRRDRHACRSRGEMAGARAEADDHHQRQQGRHRLHQAISRCRSLRARSRWSTRSAPATRSMPACLPRCTTRARSPKPGIASLSETEVHAALTLGAKAAAVTVSRAGANPPWRREIA